MSLKQIPQSNVDHYTLAGLAPDGAMIASAEHTDANIYSLEPELP